jgi:putative ABC transport system permease protein
MNAIFQKIKADLISQPLISTLIIITIIAASTLLTLALATLLNLSEPYNRSFEALNGAHVWLYFDREQLQPRDIEHIAALPNVVESTDPQYSTKVRVKIHDTRVWVSLRVIPLEQPEINRLLIQSGHYLTPGQEAVLAARDLKDLYNLETGDQISVTRADGKEVELPVVGLAYNPIWDTYRNTQPPYLYVTEKTMRTLFPNDDIWEWSMGLRLANPNAVDDVVKQVEGLLRGDALVGHTDWREVRRAANFGAQINFIFLGAFSSFAILAAMLVIASSIGSSVLSQFRQIGILKAIGFTQNQVLMLYLGRYWILGLIGTPVGLLIGIVLAPLPLRNVASSLSTTFKPPFNPWIIIGVVLTILGVVLIATFRAALKGAKANIIKAIATGAEAPKKQAFWGTNLVYRLALPMPITLGIGEVFAKPLRSFMTGLNLTLGVIGIVFGLTLNETLETYREQPALLGIVYDAVITREQFSDRKTRHMLRKAPGVEAFYSEYLVDVKVPQGQVFQVRAVEGETAAFPFKIAKGRFFRPNTYEAIAGRGLLDWLDISIGDQIMVTLKEMEHQSITWQIVGQYPEPVNNGEMLMTSWSTVERLIRPDQPRTYYLKLAPDADTVQLKHYLEPRADADLNLVLRGKALPDAVTYLQLAIFALAGILIGIAIVNIFNTSWLAVQEKLRVVGVLKTLGMTPKQVTKMINVSAGFLALLASGVGIPLGYTLTKGLLASLATTYGFGKVNVAFDILYIPVLILAMELVSVFGSLIPGQRAAQLPIVKVLRNE